VNPDFDRLVDLTDLSPEDEARLRRVHSMLVEAGPPQELPAAIGRAPAVPAGKVVALSTWRRRPVATLLIAAAVAAACFGGGYLLANQAHSSKGAIHVVRVVPMQGVQNSEAALRVGSADGNGNWPIQLTVNGLKPLEDDSRYYLMVVQGNGKRPIFCGSFEVSGKGATTVTFNVAYRITGDTKWIVTKMAPGLKYPGHVVMTTS
jgi:hypothetical protein